MKRIIITIFFTLCAIASYAQAKQTINGFVYNSEGNPIAGATIKAVGDNAVAKSAQDGSFEMQVAQHCNFVEASCEGYISAQVELNGAIVLFRLKVDKKYAQMKAKEEAEANAIAEAERRAAEEARIAAEQEAARIAAEKARAEEQARLAAEQEAARVAAEKAKAEEIARIKAQLEAELKAKEEAAKQLALQKEEEKRLKAEQQKAQAEQKIQMAEKQKIEQKAAKLQEKSEKIARIAALGEIKSGYEQYVSLAYNLELFYFAHSATLNYIGGYRFNKHLFLGLGTGLSINAPSDGVNGIDYYGHYYGYEIRKFTTSYGYNSLISIPVFAHFRADFARQYRWNPYIALSVGAELATKPISIATDSGVYSHNGHLYIGELAVGANCRLKGNMGIYFGLSCGFAFVNGYVDVYQTKIVDDSFDWNTINNITEWDDTEIYSDSDAFMFDRLNFKFTVGLSF